MEYLLVHRGGRGQSFVYELLYDGEGKDGEPFVLGLIDVDKLGSSGPRLRRQPGRGLRATWSGQNANRSAPSRPQVGGRRGVAGWRKC